VGEGLTRNAVSIRKKCISGNITAKIVIRVKDISKRIC
jgi:hypothetical protein